MNNKVQYIEIMNETVLYFLIWSLVLVVFLRFTPNDKIKLIGDFFKKVIPTIPFTKIFGAIYQSKDDEKLK